MVNRAPSVLVSVRNNRKRKIITLLMTQLSSNETKKKDEVNINGIFIPDDSVMAQCTVTCSVELPNRVLGVLK